MGVDWDGSGTLWESTEMIRGAWGRLGCPGGGHGADWGDMGAHVGVDWGAPGTLWGATGVLRGTYGG